MRLAWLTMGMLSACCTSAPAPITPVAPLTPRVPTSPLAPPTSPSGPASGISIEQAFAPERLATLDRGYDIVVLTVLSQADDGSNGAPPRPRIRIDEVLIGSVASGEHAAVWSPPPHGVDWVGAGADEAKAAWAARPLAAPRAGDRLIALGRGSDGGYRVLPKLREPYSDASRVTWIERIALARAAREP